MGKWGLTGAAFFALTALVPAAFAAPPAQTDITAALGAGNARLAEQLADSALAQVGQTADDRSLLLMDRGTAREVQGEHDDALADLTQAIEMHRLSAADQAHALFTRGAILDGLGRSNDAIGDYSAALLLEPHLASALNNRANAYRRMSRLAEAKRDYLASLSAGNLQPEYSFYGLGQIAEAAGNIDSARGFYAQAVAANPYYELAAGRLAALGGTVTAADPGIVHLHPLPSVRTSGASPSPETPAAWNSAAQSRPAQMTPASYGGKENDPGLRPAMDAVDSGAQVQLSAWRTAEEAGLEWSRVLQHARGLLEGLSPHIVVVDLPGKGRYYRLRAGPVAGTPEKLCSALLAQGLDCIPARD